MFLPGWEDDPIQKVTVQDNSWEILEKLTYQYTGGNLIEENWEGTIYGEYRPFEKFTYEYEGNKVIQALNYYYDQSKLELDWRRKR